MQDHFNCFYIPHIRSVSTNFYGSVLKTVLMSPLLPCDRLGNISENDSDQWTLFLNNDLLEDMQSYRHVLWIMNIIFLKKH